MNTPAIYDRLAELAFRKIKDELTQQDEQELADIFEKSPEKKALFEQLIDPAYMAAQLRIVDEFDVDAAWQEYVREAEVVKQQHEPDANETRQMYNAHTGIFPKKWSWILNLLAAAVAVGVVLGYFYFKEEKKTAIVQLNKKVTFDSAALANSVAMIVQANGSELLIGKEQSGIVATIGNTQFQMNKEVLLLPNMPAGVVIKTMPGKQLPFLLSDSTRGWLSGNSELHFTDGFTAGNRTMVLKGESYFDVKKGIVPFAVKVRNMELKVVGTRFSISAYDKKVVKTTLYKGKVELTAGGEKMLLSENEEAVFENNRFSKKILSQTSTERENATKTGYFLVDGKIKAVLDEVAGNYNRNIRYIGNIPEKEYYGYARRNIPIDSLLKILSNVMSTRLTVVSDDIVADFTN
jgi:transmembrane sensor